MGITTLISLLRRIPKGLRFLLRNWKSVLVVLSALIVSFALGWYTSSTYVKKENITQFESLTLIGIDATRDAQHIADHIDYELNIQELIMRKQNEVLTKQILDNAKLLNDTNCVRSDDWVRAYNESARFANQTPHRTRNP